jgi:hypothetical protein
MSRYFIMIVLAGITCFTLMTPPAHAEQNTRYEEMVESPAHSQTIRSFGMMFLAAPTEFEHMYRQLEAIWWAKQPEVEMNDEMREMQISKLRIQLKEIARVVSKHKITRMQFAGYTQIGSMQNLDLYFSANTPSGPIIIRASMSSSIGKKHRLHEFVVYDGWKESRQAVKQIQEKAGKTVVEITYKKPKKNSTRKDSINKKPSPDSKPTVGI